MNPLEKPILYKFSIKPHFQTEIKHFMKDIFVLTFFPSQKQKIIKHSYRSTTEHHSSKASILRHSAFFPVQLSHPYMTTGKTIALTRQIFVGKIVSAFEYAI